MTETSEPGPVPVLALRGLRRGYGRIEAVAGIDLHVGAGETLALLGPNGAGKSTTLAMVLGLLAPRCSHPSRPCSGSRAAAAS
jgi:ABC-2 type transport system ATP-binding protein